MCISKNNTMLIVRTDYYYYYLQFESKTATFDIYETSLVNVYTPSLTFFVSKYWLSPCFRGFGDVEQMRYYGRFDRFIRSATEGVTAAAIIANPRGAFSPAVLNNMASALALADQLETFINDARALAFARLEKGLAVPGYKLVSKRATRQWTSEAKAKAALLALDGVAESDVTETSLLSPAQAEKVLKKRKLALPADVVVAVSSGNTLAAESDPRPPVLLIGQQLTAALSKLV
jgi:hypothetical protein